MCCARIPKANESLELLRLTKSFNRNTHKALLLKYGVHEILNLKWRDVNRGRKLALYKILSFFRDGNIVSHVYTTV